jgi:NADP-dependent 3-hydroxy acid dehydrogenase YdfG
VRRRFALEAVADGFRQEVRQWGIRVTLIEPGSFKTEIIE